MFSKASIKIRLIKLYIFMTLLYLTSYIIALLNNLHDIKNVLSEILIFLLVFNNRKLNNYG